MTPASPLPWRLLGGDAARYVADARSSVVAPVAPLMSETLDMTREDAAYIVHACNLYPELLAALKALTEIPLDNFDTMTDALGLARAVIQKAEATT